MPAEQLDFYSISLCTLLPFLHVQFRLQITSKRKAFGIQSILNFFPQGTTFLYQLPEANQNMLQLSQHAGCFQFALQNCISKYHSLKPITSICVSSEICFTFKCSHFPHGSLYICLHLYPFRDFMFSKRLLPYIRGTATIHLYGKISLLIRFA